MAAEPNLPHRDHARGVSTRDERTRRGVERLRATLAAGGSEGNERLTVITGATLLALLAVIGVTIVQVRQLLWLHLFVGLALIGPLILKLASTGYRFARYYTHDPVYRSKGPPVPLLRMTAPLLAICTVAVFATGVALLLLGPSSRGQLVEIHKVSFIVWVVFFGVHVLGHLREMRLLLPGSRVVHDALRAHGLHSGGDGRIGRTIALAGALIGGLVLAVVLLPEFGAWTQSGASFHHH